MNILGIPEPSEYNRIWYKIDKIYKKYISTNSIIIKIITSKSIKSGFMP